MAWFTKGKTIAAIGRNYVAHAKELNNPVPKEPFFFLKPISSTLASGGTILLPRGTVCNHEVELGVVIGRRSTSLTLENAMQYVKGYCLAIDMTARNMQDVVKKAGLPWSAVKGFDTFCVKEVQLAQPISDFISADKIKDPHNVQLKFEIDGNVKQDGVTSNMIFDIPRQLQHVTSIMTLDEDDILLTGTPHGIGPVKPGEKILATLLQDGKELARWQGDAQERPDGFSFTT